MYSVTSLVSVTGFAVFFVLLLRLSVDDMRVGVLYDRWVGALALAGMIMVLLGELSTSVSAGAGALLGGSLLYVVRILSHGGMGGGDVKLAAALGIWTGLDGVFPMLFVAFILGSACGITCAICSRGKRKQVPFGPFLAVGGIVGVFFHEEILQFYEAWFW